MRRGFNLRPNFLYPIINGVGLHETQHAGCVVFFGVSAIQEAAESGRSDVLRNRIAAIEALGFDAEALSWTGVAGDETQVNHRAVFSLARLGLAGTKAPSSGSSL